MGSENRRREYQVGVRLLAEEHTALMLAATAEEVSPGEILRRAFVAVYSTHDGESDNE